MLGPDVERLPKPGLGQGGTAIVEENAADLPDRRKLVIDRPAGDRCEPRHHRLPLRDALVDRSGPLQKTAEVDVGGEEVGIEGQRLLQRRPRALHVASIGLDDGEVEVGRGDERVLRVEGDPDRIELTGQPRLALGGQDIDRGYDVGEARPETGDLLQRGKEERVGADCRFQFPPPDPDGPVGVRRQDRKTRIGDPRAKTSRFEGSGAQQRHATSPQAAGTTSILLHEARKSGRRRV